MTRSIPGYANFFAMRWWPSYLLAPVAGIVILGNREKSDTLLASRQEKDSRPLAASPQ
jgi:hypothetical protein